MIVWMIFIQGDDHTWLQAAWDDDATAENNEGWLKEVAAAKKVCEEPCEEPIYSMRIMRVEVPGVYEAFEIPDVTARRLPDAPEEA